MKLDINGSTVTVNGISYSGNSITINNDTVIIDGIVQQQN